MDVTYRLDRVRADGERLIEVAASDLEADVPACPGWKNARLLSHVAGVWHMLSVFADERPEGFPDRSQAPEIAPGGEVDAARTALDRVESSMRALPPGTAMWSWAQTQSSDYFHRRLHLETLVHRIDAEQAVGLPSEIDGDEASDSLDERFVEFLPIREGAPASSLHVHRTDGDGEWTMQLVDGTIQVERTHAKGDAAARGAGADLMLAMWGRGSLDPLEVFGEPALVDEWFALCR